MLKARIYIWLFAVGVTVVSLPAFSQEYVVVVNASNNVGMTKADVEKLFLGKTRTFPDGGEEALPVMQISANPISGAFMESIVGKSWTQYRSYWSKLMFTGKGYPPEQVKSDAEVKAFIAKNKNGVGYISADSVDSSVKIVLRF